MIATKECVCGQKLEFEQEDAPYINCPTCGRRVSDLYDPAIAAATPEPLREDPTFANTVADSPSPRPSPTGGEGVKPPPLPARAKGLFVIVGDETKGPYSLKQIKAMYENGQLTMDTQCCRDGDERWRALVEWESEIYREEKRAAPQPTQVIIQQPAPVQLKGERLHPATAALLGFFCLTGLAQMMMGQGGKGCMILLGALLIGFLTGGIGFLIVHPIVAIDAILVAQALRAGRVVGPYEFFPQT